MESPPSEAPPLSEDSGLLITSGSFSSDSASGWHHVASELQESDFDERSLSLCESTETSERMCGDFFNTVKKGPAKAAINTIEPPPEFQDYPNHQDKCHIGCTSETALKENLNVAATSGHTSPLHRRTLKPESLYDRRQCLNQRFASPRLLHLSPSRGTRPSSRTSLSSRLSSSHNSLVTQFQIDDSNFITQAISHDALSSKTSDITDLYNVPFDSDIYAVPIDVVQPHHSNIKNNKGKKSRNNKKRGKSTPHNIGTSHLPHEKNHRPKEANRLRDVKSKRHSLPSSSLKRNMADSDSEIANLTLWEMRKYLHTVYSNSSSDSEGRSSRPRGAIANVHAHHHCHVLENESPTNTSSTASTAVFLTESKEPRTETNNGKKSNRNSFSLFRSKKYIREMNEDIENGNRPPRGSGKSRMSSTVRILKQSFCNLFRWRRQPVAAAGEAERLESPPPAVRRALPPLPLASAAPHSSRRYEQFGTDFASSIEKVKDYGWYWGPISVEAAEKILSNEPDGSFIVRDSSDDHYIFTLTFKLNGLRHVRIEHHHGNFCFGGCTMFKASTIVEFIENAVDTSRSGRYLFFLNQRPVLGPVRVQLLYPVSRFKRVQSLQHMCRFVILKHVRRDLIKRLPLPRRMLDYLNANHYYSELIYDDV